jgi:hypothetical protein
MLAEDVDGALLVIGIWRAHPQQQPAAFKLFLQAVGVTLLEKARQTGADEAVGPAGQRTRDQRRGRRPPDATLMPTEATAPT